MDKLSSAGHSRKVCHDVIGHDEQKRKHEPKKPIENVVHNVLHLSNCQAQHHNGPTELIELKLDMSDLHGRNGQDKGRTVQAKRQTSIVPAVRNQVVQLLILLDDFCHEITVGINDGDTEPHPLQRSKERNGILNFVEMGIVSDLDELPKQQQLTQGDNQTHVNMPHVDTRDKDSNESSPGKHSDKHFVQARFIFGDIAGR